MLSEETGERKLCQGIVKTEEIICQNFFYMQETRANIWVHITFARKLGQCHIYNPNQGIVGMCMKTGIYMILMSKESKQVTK